MAKFRTESFPKPDTLALVGTSCVGKTTILEYLKEQFSSDTRVGFLDEEARKFFGEHPEIQDRFSASAQGQILERMINVRQKAQSLAPKFLISDRSPVCAVVYVATGGG